MSKPRTPISFERKRDALLLETIVKKVNGLDFTMTVALFGPRWQGRQIVDWSLAPFQNAGDTANNPERAERIHAALHEVGVGSYVAPVPTDFNGLVVDRTALNQRISFGPDVTLMRGIKADGAVVRRGGGYVASTAGCPLIVATDGYQHIVAHAGFRSLFRHDAPHRSVVANIVARFEDKSKVKTFILFSIRPERHRYSLTDPKYAENNTLVQAALKKAEYGAAILPNGGIDLVAIIRDQFGREGVSRPDRTSLNYLPSGAYDTRMTGEEKKHRNLTVVFIHAMH